MHGGTQRHEKPFSAVHGRCDVAHFGEWTFGALPTGTISVLAIWSIVSVPSISGTLKLRRPQRFSPQLWPFFFAVYRSSADG